MQTLIKTLVLLVFTISANSQTTTPEPPKNPTAYSSTHSSSLSVSKSDEDIRIKARFHKSRFETVKSLLLNTLGKDGLVSNDNLYKWSYDSDNFECKLTKTNLKLFLNYESANSNFINLIEELSKSLKYAVSGGNPEDDIKQAQEAISRAEADVARAKEELERAKANANHAKKN